MEKVTMETNYNELVATAKQFGIKYVGVKRENIVTAINEAIDAKEAANETVNKTKKSKEVKETKQAGKWYELETPAYEEGQVVDVISGWAAGRQVKIVKPSAKKNSFKGHLINPKNGELQGTLVGVDEKDITLHISQEQLVEATA